MSRTPRTLCSRVPLQLAILLLAAPLGRAVGDGEIDFGRDVQPILSDRCYTCHGPDGEARKAKLRLDQRDAAIALRKGEAAIVPGNLDDSLLVERILSDDPDEVMPPPKMNKPLSAQQKQTLQKWIEQGAEYDTHWSFAPIKKPESAGGAIDQFVRAPLMKRGIEPAPEADRSTWLRRVTLDLTGLPPTPNQRDAFLADQSPDAYGVVVDRLLGSVDYAERMAAIWLDNARYADSNGYQFDNARKMWPWRDWVIGAYRKNMPFDQFVTEQLAGDLLPGATQEQRIATGFNRNHGFTIEGGVIAEEYRVMYVNDRATTAGTLFLGLTFECSRCHDHKYDPLSTKEYYSLYAFFNNSADGGIGVKGKPIAPAMAVFDAPSRDVCSVLRATTNTPLQALALLHDPTYIEAARKLAELALGDDHPINTAMRRTLAREPTEREMALLGKLARARLAHYKSSPGAVDKLLAVGESPVDPALDRTQLAAMTDLCIAIFNLSETITRK